MPQQTLTKGNKLSVGPIEGMLLRRIESPYAYNNTSTIMTCNVGMQIVVCMYFVCTQGCTVLEASIAEAKRRRGSFVYYFIWASEFYGRLDDEE